MQRAFPGELWLVTDVETEGLESKTDKILEVAMMLVDPTTLDNLAETCILVKVGSYSAMSAKVVAMHMANGLFEDIKNAEITHASERDAAYKEKHSAAVVPPRDLSRDVNYWLGYQIAKNYGFCEQGGKIKLAGCSVNFDLEMFNSHHLLSGRLHYRTINVSTFRDAMKMWYGKTFEREGTHHRAMDGVRYAYMLLQEFKKHTKEFA